MSELPADGTIERTSRATRKYNCVAWALGDPRVAWWPFAEDEAITTSGYYWPPGIPRTESIESFDAMFGLFDFVETDDPLPEPGIEKVALYTKGDEPSHVAWQTSTGLWSSKVGSQGIDGLHESPESINCDAYGVVRKFYARPRTRWGLPTDPMDLDLSPVARMGTVTVPRQ